MRAALRATAAAAPFPIASAIASAIVLGIVLGIVFGIGFTARAGEITVAVGHNRLEPAEVTVAVGDTVTFHNEDAMPGGHTIVADDGSFSSPPLEKDASWSHTFTEPGRYAYHIEEHATARGVVIVE